jgi:hypothetical protein
VCDARLCFPISAKSQVFCRIAQTPRWVRKKALPRLLLLRYLRCSLPAHASCHGSHAHAAASTAAAAAAAAAATAPPVRLCAAAEAEGCARTNKVVEQLAHVGATGGCTTCSTGDPGCEAPPPHAREGPSSPFLLFVRVATATDTSIPDTTYITTHPPSRSRTRRTLRYGSGQRRVLWSCVRPLAPRDMPRV